MPSLLRATLFAVCLLSLPLGAQVTSSEPQITATGRGEVRIKPTRAILYLTVQTRAATAAEAAAQNTRVSDATIQSLRTAGSRQEEINNSGYSVSPDYEFTSTGRKQNGFVANNVIRVEVGKISDVGKTIDAGLAGGATQVGSAQYSGDNMDAAKRDALKLAVDAARQDAEAMAAAAGGTLGRMLSLTSGPTQTPRDYYDVQFAAASPAPGTVIRPNELTVTSMATGRWEFVSRR